MRSHRAMSKPLRVCSTAPPRPSQNVCWRSFSPTRSASTTVSPTRSGLSSVSDASHEWEAGEAAPDAGEPLVGLDLEQRVHLLVRVGAAGPACVAGGAAQRNRADVGDLHRVHPNALPA